MNFFSVAVNGKMKKKNNIFVYSGFSFVLLIFLIEQWALAIALLAVNGHQGHFGVGKAGADKREQHP